MQPTRRSWFANTYRIQTDLVYMALNADDKEIKAGLHAPLFCNLIFFVLYCLYW